MKHPVASTYGWILFWILLAVLCCIIMTGGSPAPRAWDSPISPIGTPVPKSITYTLYIPLVWYTEGLAQ